MEMYVWGNNGILKDVYRFDNTSQTRGGFEMANLYTHQPDGSTTGIIVQTLDLTDPTMSLFSGVRPAAKVSESALSSRGSPAFVPVPYFSSAIYNAAGCSDSRTNSREPRSNVYLGD